MKQTPKIIHGLSEIAGNYDAILCDVWGVLHNGVEPFAASVDALQQFRKQGGSVIMITNSPRPSSEIPAQFANIGVASDCYDAIITSGDATRALLQARVADPVFILGPKRDLPLYDGLGLKMVPLEDAAFISCTGLINDRVETPADYHDLLQQALARKLPMVCANPDIEVMIGDQRIWCGGALAQIYQKIGGEVLYAGKPHQPIYELCYAKLEQLTGRAIPPKRILAIGDGIGTDIKGAQEAKLDCLFVATGIHANALCVSGKLDAEKLALDFKQQQTMAKFGIAELSW
ncbi:MAG: TIGR01459 family HAD-type hydrolase [Robiginitomaculum sp.]|nr:TIGR01459 family HAD-type hydrolase [Robiginitomaculum sp.]